MIAIASDHAGYSLKEEAKNYLNSKTIPYRDFGSFDATACDYPDFARLACDAVISGECEKALLFCGTGIGMCISANKIKGIRAAVCSDSFSVYSTRSHNDANVLCLGERVVGPGLAMQLIDLFLETPFQGDRHQRRIDKITALEE